MAELLLSTEFPYHHHIRDAVNHLTVIKHHGRIFLHAQRPGMCHIAVMSSQFRLHHLPFGRLHTCPDHRFSLIRISRQRAKKAGLKLLRCIQQNHPDTIGRINGEVLRIGINCCAGRRCQRQENREQKIRYIVRLRQTISDLQRAHKQHQ